MILSSFLAQVRYHEYTYVCGVGCVDSSASYRCLRLPEIPNTGALSGAVQAGAEMSAINIDNVVKDYAPEFYG